jgi:predicted DNA-binding transcriptional regulator YafY
MLAGDVVNAPDVERGGGPSRATARRWLRSLAGEIPYVKYSAPSRGRRQTFWWEWPSEERATATDVWGVAIARALLGAFENSTVGDSLARLYVGQRRRLGSGGPMFGDIERMFVAQSRSARPAVDQADRIDRLVAAVFHQHTVTGVYTTLAGQVLQVEVQPWTVLIGDDGLYLYGYCVDCSKESHVATRRIYRIARMKALRRTGNTFIYPSRSEYEPSQHIDRSFGIYMPNEGQSTEMVRVRFGKELDSYFDGQDSHPATCAVRALDGGGREVTFDLYVTFGFIRWVRGFGNSAVVLSPSSVQRWVSLGGGPLDRPVD